MIRRKMRKKSPEDLQSAAEIDRNTPMRKKVRTKYLPKRCTYVNENGIQCKNYAVGKGTLCVKHGGNTVLPENLVPDAISNRSVSVGLIKFRASYHPMEFLRLSRLGKTLAEIATEFKVSVNTLSNWADKYESFSLAYEIGKDMREAWWINEGRVNLNNKRDYNTGLYKFLMMNHFGYSDKVEQKNTNLNMHGVLLVPDKVTEDEWEQEYNDEDVIDVKEET